MTPMKKKKLVPICIILLVAAVVAAAVFALGGGQKSGEPETLAPVEASSESADPLAPPDYSDPGSWAYYALGEGKTADVFLICPTVDTRFEYNMSMSDEKSKADFVGALNTQRGLYEESGRMFAPFYRQAAMPVYNLAREDWEPYLDLAYTDISASFSYYLEHENNGRPIILAGFSQGAYLCYDLMEEYFGDAGLYDRLVAVYAIGWPLLESRAAASDSLIPASGELDTGVIVSFDCEAPEVTDTFINRAGQRALSINPLNWRTDSAPADRSLNKGACFTNTDGEITEEIPEFTGCYIDPERGVLKLTDVDPVEYPAGLINLPDGAYHLYDYRFFYRNLQQNVRDRLAAYIGE